MHFGTDGVRGVAFVDLTPALVTALGRAVGEVLGGGRWLIGRDTRESGPSLVDALAAGLAAAGAEPTSIGVIPTPALAWLSARDGIPAAMVTASHNPWTDNGVKVFAAGGRKLTDDVEAAIEARLAELVAVSPAALGESSVDDVDGAVDDYAAWLVGSQPRLDGLRIVLDLAHGAMASVAPAVCRALGAEVGALNAAPDGRNINDRCGATHPGPLGEAVVASGADLGLAFDGDGDRVIAIDHLGRVVDGDRLLALAALDLRARGRLRDDTVVVTVMSNLGFHRAMAAAGIHVVTTAVGDRYVLEALDAGGFSLGGEQSGHLVYRDLATTGDGLLAGVQVAGLVRSSRRPLADLAGEVMTSYPQVLVNVAVRHRPSDAAAEMDDEITAAMGDLAGDGRIVVRASGTEPLVRVMVEAPTDDLAADLAERLAVVARHRFG